MDTFAGHSLQERLVADPAAGAELFVSAAAAVHQVPVDALPTELVRPVSWDDYVDDVVDLYRDVERRLQDPNPVVRYVAHRLRRDRPPPAPMTLVHGDWQPSNVLVGAAGHVVIDWEFARIGDPREDLGYYVQIPMEPNAYRRDPGGFLGRYRELTGLSEQQVNPRTVEWFLMIGMARLLVQILVALGDVACGRPRGVLATYLLGAVTHQYVAYLQVLGIDVAPS
jgi:aminoglycoside phosphotransferase (APT) family kinase protein